jgi:predicted amidohydrolase
MKVGLVQFDPIWENIEANKDKLSQLLEKNVADEEVLFLPEMTLTGFTMNSEKFAEEIDGPGTTYFINLSRKIKKHIFAGIIERDGDKIYNSLVHFDNYGLIVARYRKIHPFSYVNEQDYYSSTKETVITEIKKIRFGLSVCYDLRFPELYRKYAKDKVEVLVNIANWPTRRIEHWKLLLQARAIENQAFMIGVNRFGKDNQVEYDGNSMVIAPDGKILASLTDNEGIISTDLNFEILKKNRERFSFINDIKLI